MGFAEIFFIIEDLSGSRAKVKSQMKNFTIFIGVLKYFQPPVC